MTAVAFSVNGRRHTLDTDPNTLLLDALGVRVRALRLSAERIVAAMNGDPH